MKKASNTEQRVANLLERMRKVMPEINRQIEIYEKSLPSGNQIKSPKTVESKNV